MYTEFSFNSMQVHHIGNRPYERKSPSILEDNEGELEIMDTRAYNFSNIRNNVVIEEIPNKISGTYNLDYNIIHVDNIIRKKIKQEKHTHLAGLKSKYKSLENSSLQSQTYIVREKTLRDMNSLKNEIDEIENGGKLQKYTERVKDIISEYHQYDGTVKTIIFEIDDEKVSSVLDDQVRNRISLIDKYLNIAGEYITLDIIRINNCPSDVCNGCGISISKMAPTEQGTIRCPNCYTEHNTVILTKQNKDGTRINTLNTDDDSIDNFLRGFMRYQGLQPDQPDESLYERLDEYFELHDRPSGDEIKKLPLNERGRRGDTDHKMLWAALKAIDCSGYYEDANLIGHQYWGWTLHNVMQYREKIISHYHKTQKVFYEIPAEERCRDSSLGVNFRLYQQLRLVGHECYMSEFKIAENPESLRLHKKLWRIMCENANDPEIYYID